MNHNVITIGSRTFTGNALKSGSCFIAESVAGEELSIDTLDVVVDSLDDLTALPYGESVSYEHDETLIGMFYISSVKRVGATEYSLSCISAVGLLAGSMHLGGLYTGQAAENVLEDIIGGVIEYTVDDAVKTVQIYGLLPYATRRENLHQLLFALGASITKDIIGTLNIKYLSALEPMTISADRVYMGGSIDFLTPATEAQITEHAYFSTTSDQSNTLFDNTGGSGAVTNQLVAFDGPHHDLSITSGLTIVSSGVNHAVVSGVGVLTGKAYTHQTKIVTKTAVDISGAERVISVTDATLVNAANSENVAKRVLDYYSAAYHASIGLVVGDERPGDPVAYTNPFRESDTGIIKSMDISMSNTLKADAVIASGYVPTGGGNNFNHYVVLTGSGQWPVPAGVNKVRAIIISGGQGGQGGAKGGDGATGDSFSNGSSNYGAHGYYWGKGGEGGDAGDGGSGGKVYEIDLDTTPGALMNYSSGNGGTGGAGQTSIAAQATGSNGAASVLGGHSSESGSVRQYGYVNIFTGEVYAKPGASGIGGGKGTGSSEDDGEEIIPGGTLTDSNGNTWGPGTDGPTISRSGDSSRLSAGSGGGSGGGAAIGVHGINGGEGTASVSLSGSTYSARATGGPGGNGATPIAQVAQSGLGSGGFGGHGGGGGGGSGEAAIGKRYTSTPPTISETINPGAPGVGGNGGLGGLGGPGCVIIYY
jgi:hypothetical protein